MVQLSVEGVVYRGNFVTIEFRELATKVLQGVDFPGDGRRHKSLMSLFAVESRRTVRTVRVVFGICRW